MNDGEIAVSHATLYCLLSIYGGMYTYECITNGGPLPTCMQCFTLLTQLYCSTAYKLYLPINTDGYAVLTGSQLHGNIKSIIYLWDKKQLNATCIRRVSLILILGLGFTLALCNINDILLMVGFK